MIPRETIEGLDYENANSIVNVSDSSENNNSSVTTAPHVKINFDESTDEFKINFSIFSVSFELIINIALIGVIIKMKKQIKRLINNFQFNLQTLHAGLQIVQTHIQIDKADDSSNLIDLNAVEGINSKETKSETTNTQSKKSKIPCPTSDHLRQTTRPNAFKGPYFKLFFFKSKLFFHIFCLNIQIQ